MLSPLLQTHKLTLDDGVYHRKDSRMASFLHYVVKIWPNTARAYWIWMNTCDYNSYFWLSLRYNSSVKATASDTTAAVQIGELGFQLFALVHL